MAKPSLPGAVDLALERGAGTAGEGLLVRGEDVAEQPGHPAALVVVGKDAEGVEIRLEQHVRLLDPDESLDRGAVEHDLAVERLLELAAGHLDVLVHAEDVGELQPEKIDTEALGQLENVILPAPLRSLGKPSRVGRRWAGDCAGLASRHGGRSERRSGGDSKGKAEPHLGPPRVTALPAPIRTVYASTPMTHPAPPCPALPASLGNFCSACGASLTPRACAACRAELSPQARFCHRCGQPVSRRRGPPRPRRERKAWMVAGALCLLLVGGIVYKVSRGARASR